ncbi:hypothetical protein SmJEL517_g05555 [Synchytrium microbalum]|uniref:Vacuolar membrane-associated protein IML1 n=1 Tax=Synchytrium microbalum TaxID=1806994 RepID=A0A507BTU0_9FUNG|nr:uncharacterized protein SmJEL517_g05555 [Synchytrium microbalum]TPX31002.1 hypothetical protein SmJEL517_g05555 [Synchytrium microbalum]
MLKRKPLYNLWVHDERLSKLELVINPDHFPNVKVGDVLEIFHPSSDSVSSMERLAARPGTDPFSGYKPIDPTKRLILNVASVDRDLVAKSDKLQISIAQHAAACFELQARTDVCVRKINPADYTAEYVELTFRDQYIGRSEMWRVKLSLNNTAVYVGKKLSSANGVRAQVKEISLSKGHSVQCAYITDDTKAIFRSESAKYFLFIQMGKGMWDFDEDGELYSEKCLHGFLPDLFGRWKDIGVNHVVSIVLFARVFYSKDGIEAATGDKSSTASNETSTLPISYDSNSRPYRDYYRVVVDWETRTDWTQVLIPLKMEFVRFQKTVLQHGDGDDAILSGVLSSASKGNILEAINLALNPFDKHYIDRDLVRTGLAIVVVTPGPGFFEVDKQMLRLTTQRMVENGIGMDLVCLSKPPLYTVPLFQFPSKDVAPFGRPSHSKSNTEDEPHSLHSDRRYGSTISTMKSSGMDLDKRGDVWDPLFCDDEDSNPSPYKPVYSVPHWVDISFWNRATSTSVDQNPGFVLRAKMYELQMMGGTEMMGSIIMVKRLDWNEGIGDETSSSDDDGDNVDSKPNRVTIDDTAFLYERYDDRIFVGEMDKAIHWRTRAVSMNTGESSSGLRTPLSPEIAPIRTVAPPPSLGAAYSSYKMTDTVRSLDADVMFRHQNSSSDEVDTLTRKEGEALLARLRSNTPTSGSVRPSKSATALSSLFSAGSDDYSKRRRYDSKTSPRARPVAIDYEDARYGGPTRIDLEDIESDDERRYGGPTSDPINLRRGSDHQTNQSSGSNRALDSSPLLGSNILGSTTSTSRSPNRILNLRQPIRQNYINPCNPSNNIIKASSNVRRWQHVFAKSMDPSRNDAMPNWKGLCTPACLPLTTDYFPPQKELSELYQDYNHTTSPDDVFWSHKAGSTEEKRMEALLMELISQRLAQGFQLIAMPAVEAYQKMPLATSFDINEPPAMGTKMQTRSPYLSLGDQLHLLRYDATGRNIEVKRYVRKIAYSKTPLKYACAIWPKLLDSYYSKTLKFSYPQFSTYNWNYLDQYVAGYQDEMTESLRFWRTRFILIPADTMPAPNNVLSYPMDETLTEEEKRIEGFKRFEELCFARARRLNPSEQDGSKKVVSQPVNIIRVDVNISSYVRDEMLKAGSTSESVDVLGSGMLTPRTSSTVMHRRTSVTEKSPSGIAATGDADDGRLSKSSSLHAIATAMQSANGVPFKDRRWQFKLYHRVFLGSECLQWMIRSFTDIESHEDALAFGNVLLERGLFEHVKKSHKFLDGHYFYWLTKDYSSSTNSSSHTGGKDRQSPVPEKVVAVGNAVPSISTKTTGGGGGWFGSSKSETMDGVTSPNAATSDSKTIDGKLAPMSAVSINPTPPPTGTQPSVAGSTSNLVTAGSLWEHLQRQQHQQPGKRAFELSKTLIIDLDPMNRSDRQEVATLHYDTIYCHNTCYHFQLHWLLCTARLIEDLLVSWGRVADKCGLKLVEAPVEQAMPFSDENPFLSVVPIHLAVQPPSSASVIEKLTLAKRDPYLYFEHELVKSEGFVLDMEAVDRFPPGSVNADYNRTYRYTQYVHRTGIAFIQIREPGQGFYWVNNRLYLTNNPVGPISRSTPTTSGLGTPGHQQQQLLVSSQSQLTPTPTSATSANGSFLSPLTPAALRQRFTSLCNDERYLESFFAAKMPAVASEAIDENAIKEALRDATSSAIVDDMLNAKSVE